MADIRDKHNRHLFLEDKPVTHESFIANVNKAAEYLDDIADFNSIMGQEGVTDFVSTIVDSLEEESNKWVDIIEETAESILEGKSAISFTTVVTVAADYDAGATVSLPGIFRYKVGSGALMVYYNGAACYSDVQYQEVGTAGENSASVLFNFPLRRGDQLCFRVVSLLSEDLYAAIINEIQNILSVDIPIISTGTETPRYLTDRFADVINVKDYGAVGDGFTDDTEAFEKAIAYGESLGYPYVLYLPVGTYYITTLPTVPCYGTGNVLYSGYNFHPFELLFTIRGGIIKDSYGRYKIDFDCLTDEDRKILIAQIIVENMGISLDDTGRMYVDFLSMSAEDLIALLKQIIKEGGGLDIDENGKIYIRFDSMSIEDLTNLIKQIIGEDSGLTTDEKGKITIDIDSLTQEQIIKLVHRLIKNGGGLSITEEGLIYVDFSNMSIEDKTIIIRQIFGDNIEIDEDGNAYFDVSSFNFRGRNGIVIVTEEPYNYIEIDEEWFYDAVFKTVSQLVSDNLFIGEDGVKITTTDEAVIFSADETVVRTSGNQTIAGAKTFTSDINITTSSNSDVFLNITDLNKGEAAPASSECTGRVVISDVNGPGANEATRFGTIGTSIDTSGNITSVLRANKNSLASEEYAQIEVVYPYEDGNNPYALAPSTRDDPVDTEIITYDFLKDQIDIIDSTINSLRNTINNLTLADVATAGTGITISGRTASVNTSWLLSWLESNYSVMDAYAVQTSSTAYTLPSGGSYACIIVATGYSSTGLDDSPVNYKTGSTAGIYAGGTTVRASGAYSVNATGSIFYIRIE